MVTDDRKARKHKRTNKRKPSEEPFLDLRLRLYRAFFRLSKFKHLPSILTILSSIIIPTGLYLQYKLIEKKRMMSLDNPQSYVPWIQYEEVLKKLDKLTKEIEEDSNVRDSLNEIWKELDKNWIIYISPSESNEKSIRINKHIQRILCACREFNGLIDGNPYETYESVKEFQKNNNLKPDAKIGPKTWGAFIDKLEEVTEKPGSLISYSYPH